MEVKTHDDYMKTALAEAWKNFESASGGPFGACVVREDMILAVARNTVLHNDATCHAEINAIRQASRQTGSFDLSGCTVYSTTEPCPMCFSALHWARVDTIVYGTSIADAQEVGFNELPISNAQLKKLARSRIRLIAGVLYNECRQLFAAWEKRHPDIIY